MERIIQIPPELWNETIIVPNRIKFIECLKKGIICEYHLIRNIEANQLQTSFKNWQVIRIGLNCILS